MAYNTKLGYTFTTDGEGVKNHTYAEIDIDAETVTKTTWQYPEAEPEPDPPAGNGILGITISPELTLTPTLESCFPIYYEDLTDDQKENGVSISLETTDTLNGTYSVSITPTAEWYAFASGGIMSANAGEAITTSKLSIGNTLPINNIGAASSLDEEDEDALYFNVSITITSGE